MSQLLKITAYIRVDLPVLLVFGMHKCNKCNLPRVREHDPDRDAGPAAAAGQQLCHHSRHHGRGSEVRTSVLPRTFVDTDRQD